MRITFIMDPVDSSLLTEANIGEQLNPYESQAPRRVEFRREVSLVSYESGLFASKDGQNVVAMSEEHDPQALPSASVMPQAVDAEISRLQ